MVDYSWFRLLIKGIGIAVLALAVPDLLSHAGTLVSAFVATSPGGGFAGMPWYMYFQVSCGLGLILQVGLGLYLLFGGQWLIDRCLRAVYGRCPACDYDVRSIAAPHARSAASSCPVASSRVM